VQCGLDWLRPAWFGLRDEIDEAVMTSLLARQDLPIDQIVLHNLPVADDLPPGRHLLEDGVMYCSSEPCPVCHTACYWARIPRVVFGATSYDVATHGFEDLQLYLATAGS
jgi:hypothetical protein